MLGLGTGAPARPCRSHLGSCSYRSARRIVGDRRPAAQLRAAEERHCRMLGRQRAGPARRRITHDRAAPTPVRGTSRRAVAVSAGFEHTCALLSSGDVECWGANRFGQLGDGSSIDRRGPVRVQGLHGAAVAISAGGRHTCAVLARSEVECWGADYSGQVGDGRLQDRAGPVRVRGVSRAVGVSAGRAYTCAVERAGVVKCWGANAYGQLGNGTVTARRLPTRVRNLRGRAVAVSASERHTCALIRGGAVACWGANGIGQLGDGSIANSHVAVAVAGLGPATSVATGIFHTCALTAAGGVRCWGMNASGELGAGTVLRRPAPLRVAGMAGAVEVSAGGGHTCARTGDGLVSCWGANNARQLGDRSRLDSSTPVKLSGLSTPAASVAAGDRHTCVVTEAAEVACWGANDGGQLGDGSLLDRGHAVTVRGLAGDTVRVTAGESHTCALSSEGNVPLLGRERVGATRRRDLRPAPSSVGGERSRRCGRHQRRRTAHLRRHDGGRGRVLGSERLATARSGGAPGTIAARARRGTLRSDGRNDRRQPHVRPHASGSRRVLGCERPWPARRRGHADHAHRACTCPGTHRQRNRGDERRQPHVRADELGPSLVLGCERLRPARRRHVPRAYRARHRTGLEPRGRPERGRRPYLRSHQGRRTPVLGLELLGPARRRSTAGIGKPEAGARPWLLRWT